MENRFKIISSKTVFGLILSLITFLASADVQANLTTFAPSPSSDGAAQQILSNPQNQNDVELIMFVLKSIEDNQITDMDKKLAFVDTLQVSDYIKDTAKREIKENFSYSDHERISYGIYRYKKCNATNFQVSGYPDHVNVKRICYNAHSFTC